MKDVSAYRKTRKKELKHKLESKKKVIATYSFNIQNM